MKKLLVFVPFLVFLSVVYSISCTGPHSCPAKAGHHGHKCDHKCKHKDGESCAKRHKEHAGKDHKCDHKEGESCPACKKGKDGEACKFKGKHGGEGAKLFGEPLESDIKKVGLSDVLGNPDTYAGTTIELDGVVRKACEKKGCWMELSDAHNHDGAGLRVTFKDYGFFVPRNSAGSTVRLQGQVGIKTVDAKMVAHYEAEGARFANKMADGSAKEIHIIATGVEMVIGG